MTTFYVLKETHVPMEQRTTYQLQKLPDFDLYILVRKEKGTLGHWSGLQTKEQIDKIIEDDFEILTYSQQQILDYIQVGVLEQGGRATDGSSCYLKLDGKFCGFSLCLSTEGRDKLEAKYGLGSVGVMYDEEIESSLLPQFRGQSKHFWKKVQTFHDTEEYWNDKTNLLNQLGVKYYNEVLAAKF